MEGHYVIFFLLTAHEKECLNVGHHVAEEKLDTKVKYTILHNLVLTLTLSKFKVMVGSSLFSFIFEQTESRVRDFVL